MKKVLIFMLSATVLSFFAMNSVFAEDDLLCTGRIKGETTVNATSWNPNSGVTTFNDAGDLKLVDLSVLGLGMGYAPPREAAACTILPEDLTFDPYSLAVDEFGVQGFAWNTNLGFVSMYCDGAATPYTNLGYECGDFKYGVKVSADGADGVGVGKRHLMGYAYNDVFGYINFWCDGGFDGLGGACGAFDYGVVRDSLGNLSGHAYSSAGVYLVFDGVELGLPGELVEPDSWCKDKPYVCVEVTPDPKTLNYTMTDGFKLANGKDAYEINIYLKDENGSYDPSKYDEAAFFESLEFEWKDTVKLNQLRGNVVGTTLNGVSNPYKEGLGGVVYKPIKKLTISDFIDNGNGHFTLRTPISSFAPSTDGNVSETSSLAVPILVKNEQFFYNYEQAELGESYEVNDLKLMNVQFELKDTTGVPIPGVPGVVYPNGQNGLAFKFRPVWDLGSLFVNDSQDKIVGYRGIPVSISLKAMLTGEDSFTNPLISFYLDYDKNQTTDVACPSAVSSFDFHFLKDVDGKELSECVECLDDKEEVPNCSVCSHYYHVNKLENQSLNTLKDMDVVLPAVATIEVKDGEVPCDVAVGPGIISVVKYLTKEGKKIVYYGNKLPRLGGALISNPSALIRGNVYAQTSFTPSAQTESGQLLTTVNIDVVQDTVKENLAKALLKKTLPTGSGKTCNLSGFEGVGNILGCKEGIDYVVFDVKDEKTFYFINSNVEILDDIKWDGLKVLIVDGGNVYLNGNLYNSDANGQRLSLLALRSYDKKYGEAGNVYLAPNVQNIQANIAIAGSLFSYSGDKADVDAESGEPKWENNDARINALGKQIFIQGSISSRNTIGGADLDAPRSGTLAKAKTYLLLGTGEIIQNPTGEDRIRAQLYDLNYLRLFRMVIKNSPEGLPVDQQCEKGLTPDDIMAILAHENDPDNNPKVTFKGKDCNGIDPLNTFDFDGDLVAPEDPSLYAKGVPSTEKNSPVYIFYVVPSKDSFVFSKPGALSIVR